VADKRSLKILFDTYWSSAGWKSAGNPKWTPQTPPEDLAYAISTGVMFPPRRIRHQEALDAIGSLRARISPRQVGNAFASTLSAAAPALRSALGSYAVGLHMPLHRYSDSRHERRCSTCGGYDSSDPHDLNTLSFERHKWGGVRHDDPVYIAFDLERFENESPTEPSSEDRATLTSVLRCCQSMPPGAKLADLVSSLKSLVPGNTDQRRTIVSVLGFAGVLRVPNRTGFLRSFTPATAREETPWYKDDWSYPARWWRGGDGVDPEAISFWFGQMCPDA
jgi:hypothetical protein